MNLYNWTSVDKPEEDENVLKEDGESRRRLQL